MGAVDIFRYKKVHEMRVMEGVTMRSSWLAYKENTAVNKKAVPHLQV